MLKQTTLAFRTWGGARRGAGRKPKAERAGVPHTRRASLDARNPLLVTMRARPGVPNLRTERAMAGVRAAFAGGKARFGFRLVHFSVQGNHLHLIVEATNKRALARGMQGLTIRIARRVNQVVARAGSVFADRYHARALRTPREVRNALAYVLLNRQRHHGERLRFIGSSVDPCSSGAVFDGWSLGFEVKGDAWARDGTMPARSWLLTRGWRRHGPLDPSEIPGPKARERRAGSRWG